MHKNKLTSLDKCIILLSYVNDRNPGLFIQIIEAAYVSRPISLRSCSIVESLR